MTLRRRGATIQVRYKKKGARQGRPSESAQHRRSIRIPHTVVSQIQQFDQAEETNQVTKYAEVRQNQDISKAVEENVKINQAARQAEVEQNQLTDKAAEEDVEVREDNQSAAVRQRQYIDKAV